MPPPPARSPSPSAHTPRLPPVESPYISLEVPSTASAGEATRNLRTVGARYIVPSSPVPKVYQRRNSFTPFTSSTSCTSSISAPRQSSQCPAPRRCTRSLAHTAIHFGAARSKWSSPAASRSRPGDDRAQSRRRSHSSCRDSAPRLFPPPDTAPQTPHSLPRDPSAPASAPPASALFVTTAPAQFP